jgi:hypothetical protein
MSEDSGNLNENVSGNAASDEDAEDAKGTRRWRWTISITVASVVLKIVCCVLLWFMVQSIGDAVDRVAFDERAPAQLEETLFQIERLERRLDR